MKEKKVTAPQNIHKVKDSKSCSRENSGPECNCNQPDEVPRELLVRRIVTNEGI